MHLVTAENDYRLLETTQDYYTAMDNFDSSISVESIIQSVILEHHCGDERGSWISSKEDLAVYRRAISQYTHLPNIRQKAFFLRNNIMVNGAPILSNLPRDMSFVQLVAPSTTITTMSTNLGYWLDQAASLHKTLIVFSGSLTWYHPPSQLIPCQPTPSNPSTPPIPSDLRSVLLRQCTMISFNVMLMIVWSLWCMSLKHISSNVKEDNKEQDVSLMVGHEDTLRNTNFHNIKQWLTVSTWPLRLINRWKCLFFVPALRFYAIP